MIVMAALSAPASSSTVRGSAATAYPALILGAWVAGGVVAMLGALFMPSWQRAAAVGGQYAYLPRRFIRRRFPLWMGAAAGDSDRRMAAVTVTSHATAGADRVADFGARRCRCDIVALTIINCLGVKLGSRMQSVLMLLKIAAIAGLIAAGLFLVRSPHPLLHPLLDRKPSFDL